MWATHSMPNTFPSHSWNGNFRSREKNQGLDLFRVKRGHRIFPSQCSFPEPRLEGSCSVVSGRESPPGHEEMSWGNFYVVKEHVLSLVFLSSPRVSVPSRSICVCPRLSGFAHKISGRITDIPCGRHLLGLSKSSFTPSPTSPQSPVHTGTW